MYAAAAADELDKFHTIAAPDFYAFHGGKRYDCDSVMKMIKSFHDSGEVFVWTVSEPHVEANSDLAWLTYTHPRVDGRRLRHNATHLARIGSARKASRYLAHPLLPQHPGSVS
jgi:hypothetical protein